MAKRLSSDLHPYVVFLPADQKNKALSSIFGSNAAVAILRYSLNQGLSKKLYQKELVKKLTYSNKTVIENLKTMVKLGVLKEEMEKSEKDNRIVWVKTYKLSDEGKWFALLLAEERELSQKEKAEILQNIFKAYVGWVKNLSEKLHVNKQTLTRIFHEEMK